MPKRTNWYLMTEDDQLKAGENILLSKDGGETGIVYGISIISLPTITLLPHLKINLDNTEPIFKQEFITFKVDSDFRSSCFLSEVES